MLGHPACHTCNVNVSHSEINLYVFPLFQRVSELETENKGLSGSLDTERQRSAHLQERLTMEQDTQELTESDKDASTLLHNLRVGSIYI